MHPKTLRKLKEHSIAVFTFDPNGALLADPMRHPAGEEAPSKLFVFIEESFENAEECLAEIGIVRQHPYRSLHHGGFNLSPRHPGRSMSEKQVSRMALEICSVFDDLVLSRAEMEKRSHGLVRGWKSSVETNWFDKYPRGVGFSVADRDTALYFFLNIFHTVRCMISIEDFKNSELRVGRVLEAERVEGSDKLLRLKLETGEETGERQVIAGIGKQYEPADLIGKLVIVLLNLEPRTLMGFESQGMILAASDGETIALLAPDKAIALGSIIR